MQTSLALPDLDVLCVNGPLVGRCYPVCYRSDDVYYLDLVEAPYRLIQGESGEWFFLSDDPHDVGARDQ